MKRLLLSVLVLIGISGSAFAQEKSSREIRGDKFFFTYTYDQAIDRYSRTKELTISGQRNLAQSYRIMGQNEEAEETYAALIKNGTGLIPEDYYDYAMVLKSSGKYSESDVQMSKFAAQKPNDLRAMSFNANKDQFNVLSKDNGNYKIRKMEINTSSQDFGASYYKDQVVYTSSNASPKMIKRRYNWNNEPFLNLYVADVEEGQLKNREFFDKKENGKMHDGPASFGKLGTFMAYTKNAEKDKTKDKIVELQIHTRTFENDKWSEPKAFGYNNPEYNVGHPDLTEDGRTMYFVSDMPGGFGGTDLYRSSMTVEGTWGKPENLGKEINTEGDEIFPFFDEHQNTLNFASNGHFGLGDYDLFSSEKMGNTWGKVNNLGAPLNTRFDDYALAVGEQENKGYFSSNRANGSGSDDIYGLDLLDKQTIEKKIQGVAMDVNLNPLPSTKVKLYNEVGEEINSAIAGTDGSYSFLVETNKNYRLTGNLKEYIEGEISASTFGSADVIIADLYLLQEDEEEVVVLEEHIVVNEDLGAFMKMKSIYFAFDKSDITPKAAKELDKMIKVLNQYPNMEIALTSYTDCRGTAGYNKALSQLRATSSADYIKARITNPNRISGKGFGENRLVNDCGCEGDAISACSEDEHQMNRRSEFIVTKK
ncbi:MAG: hypothetical protein A3D92_07080 [Bacteroidetes bacterium RIFCSPHIGHO2_02_FULL_44_7]|nr:MAG: hypothetical protein A3D92_07080 [Bacteroidetes bacterium RIFCSPHIGHO2_02_FULL_44_7]